MNKLPESAEKCVEIFVETARQAFGADMVSTVLFGSAATGELRATSDVNLLLVVKRFEQRRFDVRPDASGTCGNPVECNVSA